MSLGRLDFSLEANLSFLLQCNQSFTPSCKGLLEEQTARWGWTNVLVFFGGDLSSGDQMVSRQGGCKTDRAYANEGAGPGTNKTL